MLRINQLKVERRLIDGLTALPETTRTVLDAWYKNAIDDMEAGRTLRTEASEDELIETMEAVNYAIKAFRRGS